MVLKSFHKGEWLISIYLLKQLYTFKLYFHVNFNSVAILNSFKVFGAMSLSNEIKVKYC